MKRMIEALEAALYALDHPESDQDFARKAVMSALSARALDLDDIYLVYYDSSVAYASQNKAKAEEFRDLKKQEYSALPWKVGSIEEFGSDAYSSGSDDGYQQGYDEGAD